MHEEPQVTFKDESDTDSTQSTISKRFSDCESIQTIDSQLKRNLYAEVHITLLNFTTYLSYF